MIPCQIARARPCCQNYMGHITGLAAGRLIISEPDDGRESAAPERAGRCVFCFYTMADARTGKTRFFEEISRFAMKAGFSVHDQETRSLSPL